MDTEIFEIDAQKLLRMVMLHVNFILIDIRTRQEFEKGHIRNAFNLGLKELTTQAMVKFPSKDVPIVIYDSDGSQSLEVCELLDKQGFLNVVRLTGGYSAYKNLTPSS